VSDPSATIEPPVLPQRGDIVSEFDTEVLQAASQLLGVTLDPGFIQRQSERTGTPVEVIVENLAEVVTG
jgi:hypothetical protein